MEFNQFFFFHPKGRQGNKNVLTMPSYIPENPFWGKPGEWLDSLHDKQF